MQRITLARGRVIGYHTAMSDAAAPSDVLRALKNFFGFDSLRSGQDAVVAAVMEGRDALAIMPTGGGKSLCYQLPALCRPGLTVVVSPLIALMKDQVDALQARGIPAAAINSSLDADEYRQVAEALRRGELKILYVAPERFAQEGFMRSLAEWPIALLAIDEAHCLSQWGHDFRPDYLRLGRVREQLGFPQTIALTATATDHVRQDILNTLQLRDPAVIISGFARSNLSFRIVPCDTRKAKFKRILETIAQWRTGIIYCSTRKNVMTVFEELQKNGCNAVAYHAGMTDEERQYSQDAFISRRADVVVATNAFGMGIDRADVRFVIHFEIPGSVEAYYQEAGRAGRDGGDAVCELLFNHADLKTQEFFFEGSNPPLPLVRALYNHLRATCSFETHELTQTVDEMTAALGKDTNPMGVSTALTVLVHAGAITRFDIPGGRAKGTRVVQPELSFNDLNIDSAALEEKSRRDHLKIEAITRYAYSSGCRQQWILDYFGETGSEPCGRCDVCETSPEDAAETLSERELLIVRKALSGVARACKRGADGAWEGIYGRGKIMDMLRGSKGASMNGHLLSLSTYGILSELTDARMKALFNALKKAGLVATTGGDMPLLVLTAKGEAVMMSRETVRLNREGWGISSAKEQLKKVISGEIPIGMDKTLYARLAEQRRAIAEEFGVPAFIVMHTSALRALATVKPTTIEGAMRLKGITPRTNKRWLTVLLEIIQEYEGL